MSVVLSDYAIALRMAACHSGMKKPQPIIVSQVTSSELPEDRMLVAEAVSPRDFFDALLNLGELPGCIEVERHGALRVDVCSGSGRMLGAVVLVTGAAQGFGRGIAEELVQAGASVVIADLNEKLGLELADALNSAAGRTAALFCPADVTKAESMLDCANAAVNTFGGIDMLINNAGVLRAGGLDELTERDFDLVTAVNYKACFICTQAVVPVMKQQYSLNQNFRGDVIQINSKSGLEGSKRNFAYAGSKFGTIGLTQSFALELIEYGIKVNAICPGNYFDGPLWSDPENGLFVQYLRTGKVPGAKTLEDVRAAYMSKIPMGRGCTPQDVARAIFYCREQQYETGQAIPVTGGQVMLN